MSNSYCERWMNRSACFLAECLFHEECAFTKWDDETNEAFQEAIEKSGLIRPRILGNDGGCQLCEQCNRDDGKAIEIGVDRLEVNMVWTHNAFNSGICRWVYICEVCFEAMVTAENADKAWFEFDAWSYGLEPDCPSCCAELPGP